MIYITCKPGSGGTFSANPVPKLVPDYNNSYICPKCNHQTPQYVKEWVGLTDEEVEQILFDLRVKTMGVIRTEDMVRAIEAKLKEKNDN